MDAINPASNPPIPSFDPIASGASGGLNPNDVLLYVSNMLSGIDGQMESYMDQASAQRDQVDSERALQTLLRQLQDEEIVTPNGVAEIVKYAELRAEGVKNITDPGVKRLAIKLLGEPVVPTKAALKEIRYSLRAGSPYTANRERLALADIPSLSKDKVESAIQDSASRVASANDAGETIMMSLSSLMQKRSQIVQFSSNVMSMLDRANQNVIQNMK